MNDTLEAVINATYDATMMGAKRSPTPFDWSAYAVAIFCVLVVIGIRFYARGIATDIIEIDVMDEIRKRDGTYRIEEYQADTKNGALQTCKKDEDGCISLKLAKKTKVNHDTYFFQ